MKQIIAVVIGAVAIVVGGMFLAPSRARAQTTAYAPASSPYDDMLMLGKQLLTQGRLNEALAATQTAAKLDSSRYEAPALEAAIFATAHRTVEAQAAIKEAIKLAPPDKQAALQGLANLLASQPVTPRGASQLAAPATPVLNAEDRRQLEMFRIIAQEAAQAVSLPDRQAGLRELLEKSRSFVEAHPEQLQVWMLRAVAAMELNDADAGCPAARRIMDLAGESGDPKIIRLLALLQRKGWIQEKPAISQPFTISAFGIDMCPIPVGKFTMGSPLSEPGRSDDEIQHDVTITKPFWLGRTPVTHGQWKALMGTDLVAQDHLANPNDNPPNKHGNIDDNEPMYYVSWDEAMAFCQKLNAHARADGSLPEGYEYMLPTEAQWEYACRAGTTDATYAGPMQILGLYNAPVLDAIAWYGGNSSVGYQGIGWDTKGWSGKQYPGGIAGPRDVGLKQPNAWGLYDMIGNVWEWCSDWYGTYPGGNVTDPVGAPSGTNRVDRGGCWGSDAAYCRSALRGRDGPGLRNYDLGFRLALSSVP